MHANVGITHATVNSQVGQSVATVLLHGVKNGFCLETGGLESSSCDVATLCVLGDTKDGALGIVNPVGCEETRECSDKDKTAVVVDRGRELRHLLRVGNETLPMLDYH